jgi:hypothetical protein
VPGTNGNVVEPMNALEGVCVEAVKQHNNEKKDFIF